MGRNLLDDVSDFEHDLLTKGYQQLEPFFVLREGKLLDERDGSVVHLTRERLQKIADVQNKRIAETGDATPIVIGHTKRTKGEEEQPRIVGLATRFQVVPFKNTRAYGLEAVPWTRPENVSEFEKHPRRSAELWTNPDLIDPISILGANTPRLDLGLHRLKRDQGTGPVKLSSTYSPRRPLLLECGSMADDNDTGGGDTDKPATPAAKAGAADGQSSELAQIKAQLAQFGEMFQLLQPLLEELKASQTMPGMEGGGMGGGPGGPGGPGAAPPVPMGPPGGGGPGGPGGPVPPGQEPQQFNMAGGVVPGGGNVMMPTYLQRGQVPYGYQPQQFVAPQPQGPLQFAYGQQVQQPQPDQEVVQLRQQVQAMQFQMVTGAVNALLDTLEKEVAIDRKRDFERLVKLSRADLEAEVAHMRNTRRPVEQPLPTEAVPLHMQADHTTAPRGGQGGPVQLSLQQAVEAYHGGLNGDPNLTQRAGQPVRLSVYDAAVEAVRNRNKHGGDPMEAYRKIMGGNVDPATGKTITPTRG